MSIYTRPKSGDFMIDGVVMPDPHIWDIYDVVQVKDPERLPGNGKLIAPYFCSIKEVYWRYKWMSQADFKLLYNTYIRGTINNRDTEHLLKTRDNISEEDVITGGYKTIEVVVSTDGQFKPKPYMIKNGIIYYKDIEIVFVGVGGEE